MKKITLALMLLTMSLLANSQIVIGSKFKPMTYDEMLAPLIMVNQANKARETVVQQMQDYLSKYDKSYNDRKYIDAISYLNSIEKLNNQYNGSLISSNVVYDAYLLNAANFIDEARTVEDTTLVVKCLEKAIYSENNAISAYIMLMDIAKNRNQMDKWAEYCNIGIVKFPGETAFPRTLINYYVRENKLDDAIKTCNKMIRNFPKDDYGYYWKAVSYYMQNINEDALEWFMKATDVNPSNAESWAGAGNTAWKLARECQNNKTKSKYFNEAIKHYLKVKELAPNNPELWGYYLYAIYNNSGNTKEANNYIQYSR